MTKEREIHKALRALWKAAQDIEHLVDLPEAGGNFAANLNRMAVFRFREILKELEAYAGVE